MDILILLTYTAIAVAVFKFLKVPVNAYTILTAAVGGVGLLSTLLLLMNYNHPYTTVARFYYFTTPVVPEVRGKVVEVPVSNAQHVQAGEILFKLDPTPFQAAVDKARAEVAAAKQRAAELKTNLVAYEEAFHAAEARQVTAEDVYEHDQKLYEKNVATEAQFVRSKEDYLAAVARVRQAKAELERARLEAESMVDGVHTDVAEAQADLAAAEFDLEQTVVQAPTDGAVLQVFLRPGMMAVPIPLKPVMVFQHDESRFFVASFLQNNAQRISEDAEAEVIFPAIPGQIFKGRVKMVGAAVAQGQLQPSGDMIDAENIQGEGRINVVIEFEDGTFEGFRLPPGSSGHVAVYSNRMRSVGIIRQVLMRMKSWTNFVFSDGHGLP